MNSESIRISHPDLIKIHEVKSSGVYDLKEGKLLHYFETKSSPGISVLILQFENVSNLNQIRLHSNPQEINFFPDTFRFDISMDGIVWEPILQETGFRRLNQKTGQWNFSLVQAKFLKLVGQVSEKDNSGKYKISLGQLEVGISGIVKIQVSSEHDRFWVKENLIDQRPDYGWSSKEVSKPGEEFFLVDLGSISRVNELRLLTPKSDPTFFPESFTIYYSEDDLSWSQLLEENQFLSEPGVWYQWRFLPANVRYLKLVARQKEKKNQGSYQSKIVELELYATPHLSDLTNKPTADPLPYATVLRSGLVRLAVDGENSEGVAIQSNDRRLRDASTEYKGIVELAGDGEDKEGVVIQGNDKRLKHATELTHGLVRLASNGENRAERVVQGNDDRLRAATTASLGIVELAENGETKEGVVVQGNDDRLKIATSKKYGLVILSEPGGSEPGRAVTADDPRIKKASTEFPGIVRFARSGEDSPEAAVQGNDKRLKIATTEAYGIVQLARSGESKEGLVVQGNDERLRKATTSYPGIVEIATLGTNTPGKVVSADDPRLSDKRDPKPHTHDYASLNHDFSSHTGFLKVKGVTEAAYTNISPPPENHAPIYGKNESEKGAGMIGVARDTGLIGYGEKFGVRGDSSSGDKEGAGVVGLAKRGFGGVFHSRSGVALFATGKGIPSFGEVGSGKAFLAEGESEFSGTVRISTGKDSDCIARFFPVNPADIISEGDILVMGEDGRLQKAKTANATHTIGVAVKSAALSLGDKAPSDGGHWLVAVSGVVTVNADASSYPIQPGSLLVTGLTGGHAVRISAESLRPGSLFGKALTPFAAGEDKSKFSFAFNDQEFMKKVSEIYGSAKGPVYSFEFFPPKTQDGDLKLMGTVKELARLDPDFVTVTYGAGGSTRDKTVQILSEISKNYSFPTVSHFTCVGANQDQIFKTLKEIRSSGIVNLMALRGDPPKGEGKFKKTEGGFENATELISFIRSEKLDFCIGGGCYPEKHPNAKSLEEDVRNLKRKVDAGTDFLVSQLFFVNSIFENFLNLVRKADIRVPVIPGIMPITSFSQIERFRSIAGCEFPSSLIEDLQEVEHRPEEFYRRSLNFSIKQCRELLAMGVPGIHLYTLNQSHASYDIVRELKS